MDTELMSVMSQSGKRWFGRNKPKFRFADGTGNSIEIDISGEMRTFPLKPLPELYGKGTGLETIDPLDEETWMPLLLAIDEAIMQFYKNEPGLTDAKVLLALEDLSMDPAGPAHDSLKQAIQARLRLTLSMNDYSRQEVKMGLRKIAKSVQRHTRLAGPRGYLEFITGMYG